MERKDGGKEGGRRGRRGCRENARERMNSEGGLDSEKKVKEKNNPMKDETEVEQKTK